MKLVETLKGASFRPPPIWLMRQAGRYLPEYLALREKADGFVDFCLRPDLAAEATLQPLARYDLDAAILFADILLIPYAVGAGVHFVKGEGPVMNAHETREAVEALNWENAVDGLSAVYETVARVRQTLGPSKALIGFAGAPWTVATYMAGGGKDPDRWRARTFAWRDREGFDVLIDRLVEATTAYLVRQVEAGADVLKLFDSWTEALPEPLFERVVIGPTKRIVRALKQAGVNAPIIGFPRGSGLLAARYARETGIDGLALDMTNASTAMIDVLPTDLVLQGGFDPALLAAGGPDFEVEVERLLTLFENSRYIFNLGHGISLETPPENVGRLVDLVKSRR